MRKNCFLRLTFAAVAILALMFALGRLSTPRTGVQTSPVLTEAGAEAKIRGVAREDINAKRGVRGHASEAGEWNGATVVEDYARIGIAISRDEGDAISAAILEYTSPECYPKMRAAATDHAAGKPLDSEGERWLARYQSVMEYTRTAPSWPPEEGLFRGVAGKGEYADWLRSLKVGDNFDLGRPGSFSTLEETARGYAGEGGILLSVVGGVRDGISLSGFSFNFAEKEVLVTERYFTVEAVSDDATSGTRTITLRLKTLF